MNAKSEEATNGKTESPPEISYITHRSHISYNQDDGFKTHYIDWLVDLSSGVKLRLRTEETKPLFKILEECKKNAGGHLALSGTFFTSIEKVQFDINKECICVHMGPEFTVDIPTSSRVMQQWKEYIEEQVEAQSERLKEKDRKRKLEEEEKKEWEALEPKERQERALKRMRERLDEDPNLSFEVRKAFVLLEETLK